MRKKAATGRKGSRSAWAQFPANHNNGNQPHRPFGTGGAKSRTGRRLSCPVFAPFHPMKNKASARFYPGTERGHTDNQHFRSEYTFPFGSYQDAGKPAFGPLYLLNDETLAPEQQVRLQPEERTLVVVLPLSGAVDYRDTEANDTMLSAGSAGLFVLGAGSSYRLRNPYDAAVVHYLQLWFA
ncbi:MAG: hypothetical protein EOO16_15305, partial [Chitinophagaceae bacterium]